MAIVDDVNQNKNSVGRYLCSWIFSIFIPNFREVVGNLFTRLDLLALHNYQSKELIIHLFVFLRFMIFSYILRRVYRIEQSSCFSFFSSLSNVNITILTFVSYLYWMCFQVLCDIIIIIFFDFSGTESQLIFSVFVLVLEAAFVKILFTVNNSPMSFWIKFIFWHLKI